MEFEVHDEQDEEMEEELPPNFDSLGNTTRPNSGPEPILSSAGISAQRKPRYRECLKNHAVGNGGHAVDGCGEFMAAGAEGTLDGLKCAACSCHRNFHRKESADVVFHHHLAPHHHHQVPQFMSYYRTPSGYLHVAPQQQQQQYRPLALPSSSGGGGSHSRGEDQEDVSNPGGYGGGGSRKRHRTKFTQEQKEKMLELAERLGWRLQKHDEDVVQHFCNETGVRRQVLKVWMHNNKHTLGKKP